MVIWSNCHLSPNSRLVIKSGYVSIREKYLTKATHLTGRKRYSWSIKSNIDDHIRKLDTKIRNKETELNALYTKIQKLEEEIATLILGYSKTRDALLRYVDSEDKQRTLTPHASVHKTGTVAPTGSLCTYINESGFYSLVLSSK